MITVGVFVLTLVRDWPVHEINGKPASFEGTHYMPNPIVAKKAANPTAKVDRYSAERGFNPQGPLRIGVELEEKISGPTGSYSSVTVRVSMSTNVEQSQGAAEQVRDTLFDDCSRAVNFYMQPALEQLIRHVENKT